MTSLKAQRLISLEFDGKSKNETTLFEKVGRVRDVEQIVLEIYVIIDNEDSGIWKLVNK